LARERRGTEDSSPDNDNLALPSSAASAHAAVVDGFRGLTVWLILASAIVALSLTLALNVRVNPEGTALLECMIGSMLLLSRVWWRSTGHERIADACGVVGIVALGGMACGAFAMLELRLHFPLADSMLRSWDLALGIDGLVITDWLFSHGTWIHALMAPAYNYTIPIFFGGLVILSLIGDRIEAWRAAFCFVGTLFTTCFIAIFVPAKGLGVWASPDLFDRLPQQAMRTFWPHFDEFYFGADPVLRLQVVDGVISFPSFHSIVGFLVLAMWRKRLITLIPAATWLFFMLLATLPGGGHYVVDLIAGFAVWAAWFALSRRIEQQLPRQVSPTA
jgi:membrane-associated phospholipid phosphatase